MAIAIVIGLLAAAGTYLVLLRGLARIALGFILIGHAVNVLLVASGGTARRHVPIVPRGGVGGIDALASDPLPQAFALTAIVIGFGLTAFLLTLADRSRDTLGDDDTEQDA